MRTLLQQQQQQQQQKLRKCQQEREQRKYEKSFFSPPSLAIFLRDKRARIARILAQKFRHPCYYCTSNLTLYMLASLHYVT